jgi:hypothetical protein
MMGMETDGPHAIAQCMWKSTTKIGMAVAKAAGTGPNGAYYTVGRYSPAGNIYGQTPF